MELRQLRAFVAVAEERNFTRAAERLHLVQSAVSASVRNLERELGAELVDRRLKPVVLTDAGRALLPEARATLAAAEAARESVEQVHSGLRGTVRLGVMQARWGAELSVPRILWAFRQDHPEVEVLTRHTGGSAQMAGDVREGTLDMAFVALPESRARDLLLTALMREPILLACHRDHPLAQRSSVALPEIAGESFADVPVGWGTRMSIERALAMSGLTRTVTYEVNDVPGVLDYVSHQLAVALIPASFVGSQRAITLVPVADPTLVLETSLAVSSHRRLGAAAAPRRWPRRSSP